MRRAVSAILGGAAIAVALCGCSGSGDSGRPASVLTEAASSVAAAAPSSVPPYRLEARDDLFDVFVDRLYSDAELQQIVADLQSKYGARENGYFVRINCSTGGTSGADNRLANAKFAVGALGAARTGLAAGQLEFEPVAGSQCPVVLPSAVPDALTAEQVVDAFTAAGLPATDPRDNSGNCKQVGCVQLITTDDVSAYQFPDPESASKWATGLGESSYMKGLIVLRFNLGGSDPTDPAAIPQYQSVLDGLAG